MSNKRTNETLSPAKGKNRRSGTARLSKAVGLLSGMARLTARPLCSLRKRAAIGAETESADKGAKSTPRKAALKLKRELSTSAVRISTTAYDRLHSYLVSYRRPLNAC